MEGETQGDEESAADDDEERAHRERRRKVQIEGGVDRERQRLGDALEAAREHDRGSELAEPAREGERLAPGEPAPSEGEDDAEERPRPAGAERARGRDEVGVDLLERGDRLAHVERARDVGDGDDNGRLRQPEPDAERVERPAEQPEAAEGRDQPDSGDGGR